MILDKKERIIKDSKSPLQFLVGEGSNSWDLFLTIKGERIFRALFACGTCACSFDRLPGNKKLNLAIAQELSTSLSNGLTVLDEFVLTQAEMLVPDGDYFAVLCKIKPVLCHPGDNNDYFSNEQADYAGGNIIDPKTSYYRLHTKKIVLEYDAEDLFVEFLVPIQMVETLDMKRVAYYQARIK